MFIYFQLFPSGLVCLGQLNIELQPSFDDLLDYLMKRCSCLGWQELYFLFCMRLVTPFSDCIFPLFDTSQTCLRVIPTYLHTSCFSLPTVIYKPSFCGIHRQHWASPSPGTDPRNWILHPFLSHDILGAKRWPQSLYICSSLPPLRRNRPEGPSQIFIFSSIQFATVTRVLPTIMWPIFMTVSLKN